MDTMDLRMTTSGTKCTSMSMSTTADMHTAIMVDTVVIMALVDTDTADMVDTTVDMGMVGITEATVVMAVTEGMVVTEDTADTVDMVDIADMVDTEVTDMEGTTGVMDTAMMEVMGKTM